MNNKNSFWKTLCWLREYIENKKKSLFWISDLCQNVKVSKVTANIVLKELIRNQIIEQVATLDMSKSYRVLLTYKTLSFLYVAYLFQENDNEITEQNLHSSVKKLFGLFKEIPIDTVWVV